MIRYIIATHGRLAEGFKSSLRIIIGKEYADQIETVNAFDKDEKEDVKSLIGNLIKAIPEEDQAIIFTDLMHGSVNQFIMPYADDSRIFVISGSNMPIMCEVICHFAICNPDEKVTYEYLRHATEDMQKELVFVNEKLKKETNSKEEDFFE